MKTYTFGDVSKTLKRNTFAIEKQVLAVVGATDATEARLIAIQKEFEALSKEMQQKKLSPKRSEAINARILAINNETLELNRKLRWSASFESCMAVAEVLLVEGSKGLTEENFGRFDAEGIWEDFFTAPSKRDDA